MFSVPWSFTDRHVWFRKEGLIWFWFWLFRDVYTKKIYSEIPAFMFGRDRTYMHASKFQGTKNMGSSNVVLPDFCTPRGFSCILRRFSHPRQAQKLYSIVGYTIRFESIAGTLCTSMCSPLYSKSHKIFINMHCCTS